MASQKPTGEPEASAHLLEMIAQKRSGLELSASDIGRVVGDYVAGRTPDYQMAAWLATIASIGMDIEETAALTEAYVAGGQHLDLSGIGRRIVDKHSTGGVGDKVSLVVAPIVAACGLGVAKMSGRGLGYAGGTIDKLESIPGLRLDLPATEVRRMIETVGMALAGQSAALAPGDKATYALRDVTGAVESVPLIAASIMSKKLAVRADGLVLDVKTGSGALLPEPEMAMRLAQTMVDLAERFGLSCLAIISDMSQPLGYAVGNALEVKEAIACLKGDEVPGLSELCRVTARLMLQVADPGLSPTRAEQRICEVLDGGQAHSQFLDWAQAQGADPWILEDLEARLPTAECRDFVRANRSGWVEAIDPRAVGNAALRVGAGRLVQDSVLEPAAGVLLHKRVGDWVTAGEVIAELHHNGTGAQGAFTLLETAIRLGTTRVCAPSIVHQVIRPVHEAHT